MEAQGIFRGQGRPQGKIAFLFPGQGSQYLNMGREFLELSPIVTDMFREADQVMTPILGRPLSDFIFVDVDDSRALMQAEMELLQTEITQPAMLALDIALLKLLAEYGFHPDMVMGHSLGEYAALIAAGVMPFADALEAVAARGSEMARVSMEDNGRMAAVLAPYEVVLETLSQVDGYVVPANINSYSQSVIGGASDAVVAASARFEEMGYRAIQIPVSHAFHTSIVAPASAPLRAVLDRLHITEAQLPVVANVTGDFYPHGVTAIKDILQTQVASPVQWVKGLETLYGAGVRMFVEVGPKRALRGFVRDVFREKEDVFALLTNHPKTGALPTFNQALCGLYAAGYVGGLEEKTATALSQSPKPLTPTEAIMIEPKALEEIVLHAIQKALAQTPQPDSQAAGPYNRNAVPLGSVVISGTGLGLPGAEKAIMDPDNAMRILHGEQFIDLIPERFRNRMVDKRITRLVKGPDGAGSFYTITDPDEVIKLAGRPGQFDLQAEYGVPPALIDALDITSQLAIAAGLDALREAGIPLVQTYRRTSTGKYLPDRWLLPEALRDDTGVIFASAFPGGDQFAQEFERYYTWHNQVSQLEMLEDLRRYTREAATLAELDRRIDMLRERLEADPYTFDRRFLFRILSMGHSQFAQYIGARGPNTHVNAACASTAQAVALAEDWIRNGRCRRVVVIGADSVTSDALMEWVGSGFLSVGAVSTRDRVEEAALPFDVRRHGTIIGMGACGLVVESEDALRERGMRGIVELLSSETSNSAFHGTRLDVNHIAHIMGSLIDSAEKRFGLDRQAVAPQLVFMSHETFTPARGGSAAAEIVALRETFGQSASDIVIANTKGFTGHPMGVGIEDVIAVKILEHGIVPPVPNFKEVDPDLGLLNLSRGGRYPVQFALHLAAGFGSQIAMTLIRRIPGGLDRIDDPEVHGCWLAAISGYDTAGTEVEKRVLRIQEQGAPLKPPAPSTWIFGTGPTMRAAAPNEDRTAVSPARIPQPAPAPVPVRATTPSFAPPPSREVRPQPAPAPAPVPVKPAGVADPAPDTIAQQVVALVAAQTGYPPDMLDLDLDLEADLGIDTVKQAETFLAIREAYGIPLQQNVSLRDYNTLEKVIGFVKEMRPDLLPTAVPAPPPSSSGDVPPSPVAQAVAAQLPDSVSAQILALVAQQTGYPQEMLDLDLDLEADLGIDTVKQAETFLAIREAFNIPQQENVSLRDYNTLEKVIGFVYRMRPDLQPAAVPAPAPVAPPSAPAAEPPLPVAHDSVAAQVLALVADQTGYPQEMLDLDLDLEADLGIDTVKQAETFLAIREAFNIPQQENVSLRDYNTLEKVIGFVYQMRPDLLPTTVSAAPPPAPHSAPLVVPPDTKDGQDAIVAQVLALVAAQTGYPQEMLELDLDLEADLGIDTVKQAETFLAIRETFDIAQQENVSLRDYNTLAKVVGFVRDMRPDLAAVVAPPQALPAETPVTSVAPTGAAQFTGYSLEDANLMPRRVPVPSLRPSLELCLPTGVTLNERSRVVLMPDQGGVGKALAARLQKLGVAVLQLTPQADQDALQHELDLWLASGLVQGVYWLPALDIEPDLNDMDDSTWRELNSLRVKGLYTTMRALYDQVNAPGTFLVAATRLGGLHGYGRDGATAPLGGAVTGFTKAYGIEQRLRGEGQGPLIKAVDFADSRKTAALADALIAETLHDPGVVEVGLHNDQRYSITLREEPAVDGRPGLTLDQDSVFLVTGAAGGITSAIVADLAAASRGIFFLLDLVAEPDRDSELIRLFRQDRDALKGYLIEAARASGERPTPATIEKQIAVIERDEAALRAIEAVEAAGGTVVYRSVNLLDGPAVSAIVGEIRETYDRIDVLIHAAGLLIDRTLPNKEPRQFNLVFDVKADGFFHLLHAAGDMPLGAVIAFSSVAGRFGNNGQTDYSAANDLLCKLISSLRRQRPETRAIAIDWTAWGDIGMAARGSVPTIMKALGIDMLPPQAGIPTVRRELVAGGFSGELLVAGALGVMAAELHETGGLDTAKADQLFREAAPRSIMIEHAVAAGLFGGLQLQTRLDPAEQPFLYDHAPDPDTPWLPGVMAIESMAEAAAILAPGYQVTAVTNVEMLGAFKFFRSEPRLMYLDVTAVPGPGEDLLAHVTLRSVTEPAREGLPAREHVHFRAQVVLSRDKAPAPSLDFTPPPAESLPTTAKDLYQRFFHGPAYQVLARVAVEGGTAQGLFARDLPPQLMPEDSPLLMAPRLVEMCFQAAAQWHIETNATMAFPLGLGSLAVYGQEENAAGRDLFALLATADNGETFDAHVVDETGRIYAELRGYRTVSRPGTEASP